MSSTSFSPSVTLPVTDIMSVTVSRSVTVDQLLALGDVTKGGRGVRRAGVDAQKRVGGRAAVKEQREVRVDLCARFVFVLGGPPYI